MVKKEERRIERRSEQKEEVVQTRNHHRMNSSTSCDTKWDIFDNFMDIFYDQDISHTYSFRFVY